MKQITKKQWKELRESDRKLILKYALPNMIEYYQTVEDTSNECNCRMWQLIKQYTKYDKDGRVAVRDVYPGNIKVKL